MRPTSLISSLVLLAAATTAWPSWDESLEAAKQEFAPILRRADASSSKFDLSVTAVEGNTATTKKTSTTGKSNGRGSATASASGSGSKTTAKGTGKSSGKSGATTGSGSATGSGKSSKQTKYETTKTFDERLPAGGVAMITPNSLSAAQYYKIKDYVTFAWNYTSLSITPSAVDVLASCSLNSATYTIAMNQSITGATQAVTWDTGAYQATATLPLLVETYTLIIHDAALDASATAKAGYLGTYEQFTFGMYTPQPYTPIQDYVCATCNSAMSSMERHTWRFMFGMVAITVLSFGWFAGVAGLW